MIHKTIQIQEVTVKELTDKIAEKVALKIEPYINELNVKKHDFLLSRKEAAECLKVSLMTIYKWTKVGILKSYHMGNRVYYKKEEIYKTLEENSSNPE